MTTLERCHTSLVASGDRETAHLVSVAILELRTKLNRIEDSELKAFCDAMLWEVASLSIQPGPPEILRQRAPVSLKLVK